DCPVVELPGGSEGPRCTSAPGPFRCCGDSGLGHDLHVHSCGDVLVQTDLHLVVAEGLDRLADLDLAAVHGLATGGDRLGDVLGGHRAEQAAVRTGPDLHHDRLGLQRVTHRVRVLDGRDGVLAPCCGDLVDLLLPAL